MEDLPVSFTWISPKGNRDGDYNCYCFAYIRDPKTYNVLYAGVKFNGKFSELKNFKKSLRKTAVERLRKKPIYAIFSLGDDENYKKNLSDEKFKFNGLMENTLPKKSVALAKFFLYCGLNQSYSDLGISASKTSPDFKFLYNKETEKYEVAFQKNVSKNDLVYLNYGYEYKGDEMKRITMTPASIENIFLLRKRAKFYGTNKERKSFEDYSNLDESYLSTFGILQTQIKEQPTPIKMKDYLNDKKIIFYRVRLSKNTQAHISLMEFQDWNKFVSDIYGKNIYFEIPGLIFNTYCLGFYITKNYHNNLEKKLYRKIAIDRMIDRPTIIDADFFDNMKIKDIRTWFGDRINYFSDEGMGRIDYTRDTFNLTSYFMNIQKHNELVRVYEMNIFTYTLSDLLKRLLYPVYSFLGRLIA